MKPKNTHYAAQSPLGKDSVYTQQYDAKLLFPLARSEYRSTVEHVEHLASVKGYDYWNCYELSWLDSSGKPVVYCAAFEVPAASAYIIESKSLKLYLGSLNQHRFETVEQARVTIEADLSHCLREPVKLQLSAVDNFIAAETVEATLLDMLPISCSEYERNPALLHCERTQTQGQVLVSHLLRSNCPVTNQPDWATVTLTYSGAVINHESLLAYIISYRQHSGFHEQCVEQIYCDIMHYCEPEKLTVAAQYTRRGGIDINPARSNFQSAMKLPRMNRQ